MLQAHPPEDLPAGDPQRLYPTVAQMAGAAANYWARGADGLATFFAQVIIWFNL